LSAHQAISSTDTGAVNRGFSKQSFTYDEADRSNVILQDLRRQVYQHVESFLKPKSRILELNAGTGIDALYFVSKEHSVHATDLSDGMISSIRSKIATHETMGRLTCQQLSYEELKQVTKRDFDLVFSNFGGLNCIRDLKNVAQHLPSLLRPQGYVVWVIMPPVSPWELAWFLKGDYKRAVRRLTPGGTRAHLEGEYFQTYYHSLSNVRSALGPSFKHVRSEALGLLSPPPHATAFVSKYPRMYKWLRRCDAVFKDAFPFNRWGDHIITTFIFQP